MNRLTRIGHFFESWPGIATMWLALIAAAASGVL